MPLSPATIRSLARLMNNPCSMIPARAERVAARAAGLGIGAKRQSKIMLPESVTNCVPSSSVLIFGVAPSDSRNRICDCHAKGATSTGNEKCVPRIGGEFRIVDGDDLATGGLGDYFFTKERAASTFNKVQIRIDFVCAVDGEIEICGHGIVHQGNAGFLGQLPRSLRSGEADDVLEDSVADELRDAAGSEVGGGSGT